MTTNKVWLPDRHTDAGQKWSLCAAMLRRRHKKCKQQRGDRNIGRRKKPVSPSSRGLITFLADLSSPSWRIPDCCGVMTNFLKSREHGMKFEIGYVSFRLILSICTIPLPWPIGRPTLRWSLAEVLLSGIIFWTFLWRCLCCHFALLTFLLV